MPIQYPFLHCATLFLSLAITSIAPASADESINGRIRNAERGSVRVCFDHGVTAPASGDEFTVIRHVVAAPAKSPSTIRSQEVGMLRIVAAQGDGCAEATLVNGNAQALDWVATLVHR